MRRHREQLLEVELVEDDADEPGAHHPPGARGPTRTSSLAAVPRRVWAGAAVVAAVALGGAVVVDHTRDAAEAARLAGVDGLSVTLAGPLDEVWRSSGAGVVASRDDVLLLAASDGLRAVDPGTGEARYTQDGLCEVADVPPSALHLFPTTRPVSDDAVLLCLAEHTSVPGGAPFRPEARVLDLATGEPLRTVPLEPATTWAALGTDLVTLGVDADQRAVAARSSLVTGERLWTYRGDEVVDLREGSSFSTTDTVLRMSVGAFSVSLDAATGVPLAQDRPQDETWGPFDLPGGLTVVVSAPESGTASTVHGPGGERRFTAPGVPLTPVADDGSLDGTLLLTDWTGTGDPLLIAVDAGIGARRWVREVPRTSLAVLSGRVVARDASATTVLDGADGAVVWSVAGSGDAGSGGDIVTDGRRLLSVEEDDAGDAVLVARDLETGATTWSAPSPAAHATLSQLAAGTVLVIGSGDVVALRP